MMSDIKKSAEISPDGMYRYSLERTWDEGETDGSFYLS